MEIEHLQNVSRSYLDQRERYWIEFYRTCVLDYGRHCGYNIRRGGHSNASSFDAEMEREIIRLYETGTRSINQIAQDMRTSSDGVKAALAKAGVPLASPEEVVQRNRSLYASKVVQLLPDGTPAREFDSSMLAAEWLIAEGIAKTEYVGGVASAVRRACWSGHQMYGYLWDMPDMEEEEKRRRWEGHQRKVREMDRKSQARRRQEEEARRREAEDAGVPKEEPKPEPVPVTCPICGGPMSHRARRCRACLDEERARRKGEGSRRRQERIRSGEIVPELGGVPISEVEIRELIRFHSWEEIGRKYGVTGAAAKQFAKRNYGIVVNRHRQYVVWNEERQCNEYCDEFPLSVSEIQDLYDRGILLQTMRDVYGICEATWYKYRKMIMEQNPGVVIEQPPNHPQAEEHPL